MNRVSKSVAYRTLHRMWKWVVLFPWQAECCCNSYDLAFLARAAVLSSLEDLTLFTYLLIQNLGSWVGGIRQQACKQMMSGNTGFLLNFFQMVQAFTHAQATLEPDKGGKFQLLDGSVTGEFVDLVSIDKCWCVLLKGSLFIFEVSIL